MATYGKGTWARLALNDDMLEAVKSRIENYEEDKDKKTLLLWSATWATLSIAADEDGESVGINPFNSPRVDSDFLNSVREDLKLGTLGDNASEIEKVRDLLIPDGDASVADVYTLANSDKAELELKDYYGSSFEDFKLSENVYAFWVVLNKKANLDDLESQKESLAIASYDRPFKLLKGDYRKDIVEQLDDIPYIDRKQFLVLMNLENGRVYSSNASKPALEYLGMVFSHVFQAELSITKMTFGSNELPWEMDFHTRLVKNNNIENDLREFLENHGDKEKIDQLVSKYPILEEMVRKGTLFNEYSDSFYIIQSNTPAVFTDSGMEVNVTAGDNISCASILDSFGGWQILNAHMVFKDSSEQKLFKLDIGFNPAQITTTFKNLEFTNRYMSSYLNKEELSVGSSMKYGEIVGSYLEMLEDFEDKYLALIRRVFEIDANDTSTGVQILGRIAQDEDSEISVGE